MVTIVHIFIWVCMIQYICMGEPLSFPLSSTSKSLNPLATGAGVCILSVDSTGSIHESKKNLFVQEDPAGLMGHFHCFRFSCGCSGLEMYTLGVHFIC